MGFNDRRKTVEARTRRVLKRSLDPLTIQFDDDWVDPLAIGITTHRPTRRPLPGAVSGSRR
jgi:hypothetical protein